MSVHSLDTKCGYVLLLSRLSRWQSSDLVVCTPASCLCESCQAQNNPLYYIRFLRSQGLIWAGRYFLRLQHLGTAISCGGFVAHPQAAVEVSKVKVHNLHIVDLMNRSRPAIP